MVYGLFGGPLAGIGYVLESDVIPAYKHFFSDRFGYEKRQEYLNYIRLENSGSGCYCRTWEFFISHPVATYRLLVVGDVASRALITLGCALSVTAAAYVLGLPTAGIIGLNCLVITPLVTKILQFKWDKLRCLDQVMRGIVLVAGLVSQCSSALFSPDAGLLHYLSVLPWILPGIDHNTSSYEAEHAWNEILFYKSKNKEFIDNSESYTAQNASDEIEALQARVNEHGECEESRKVMAKFSRLFITRTVADFHSKFIGLQEKIRNCPQDDLDALNEILDEVASLGDMKSQLELLVVKMHQIMRYENKKNSHENIKMQFKAEWAQITKDTHGLQSIFQQRIIDAFFPQMNEKLKKAGIDGQKELFEKLYNVCARIQNPFELNPSNVNLVAPLFDLEKKAGLFATGMWSIHEDPVREEAGRGTVSVPQHQDAATTCGLIMLYTCICCMLCE